MSNVTFIPGLPLGPGRPLFPFGPGTIAPGRPGGPGSPLMPGGP